MNGNEIIELLKQIQETLHYLSADIEAIKLKVHAEDDSDLEVLNVIEKDEGIVDELKAMM